MTDWSKADKAAIRILLAHARRDLNYGVNGTYGDGIRYDHIHEVEQAKRALALLAEEVG